MFFFSFYGSRGEATHIQETKGVAVGSLLQSSKQEVKTTLKKRHEIINDQKEIKKFITN